MAGVGGLVFGRWPYTYQLGLAFAIFVLMFLERNGWATHGHVLTEPMLIMRHDIHMTARIYDLMRNNSWNRLPGLCVCFLCV